MPEQQNLLWACNIEIWVLLLWRKRNYSSAAGSWFDEQLCFQTPLSSRLCDRKCLTVLLKQKVWKHCPKCSSLFLPPSCWFERWHIFWPDAVALWVFSYNLFSNFDDDIWR